ncbi:MAG: hypothetical protein UV71_C0003G0041 [Microgenomates group bacterium GW2011_GWC1_43_13]|uniref:DUF4870 domain-containing protein n=3 Tax=Candidatus Woeseibacteriota TaxID=1752722 RepID=A0A837IE02_9BACT|nr:MAG: hypothetical protein UV71_C0003G0041 [Microgenomates group bacterium GW2011_GWC1_43_13]KKT33423.1 MAG: hypothetical protein UW20_C0002G0014 [Candidatus Woesebacteria bacterium GW2011_GWB1_44_11]KKT54848.1 MAG: hypothetical protein UW47_C0002G0032 [Candidatus Woesebacteria bacterium GW2011_GWA1_44_23]OGM76009.1 MAG: hypothetical protein A2208_02940 [Candidatus Woesebacteria bacterium RIFOXYA1_FULL_43_16]OGM81967.1 MAG: hypothetical protein A2394_03105 [Candidatus Woesebacteria bacterium 
MAETGLKKTTSGALAYVLGPVTGIIFLVIEKDPFVRFHAMQSTVVFVALFVLQWIFGITIILFPLSALIGIISFALWLILIYKAWQGEQWEVPVLGKVAKDLLKKV